VGLLVWQHNKERIAQLEVQVNSPRADMGVNTMARILQNGGRAALEDILDRRMMHHRRPFPMLIIDEQGVDVLDRPVPELMLRKARQASHDPQQSAIREVTTPEGETFLLFVPRQDHPAMLQQSPMFPEHLPLLPLLIPFVSSLLFSAVLAWYITRPLRFLREATNRFAEGRLDARVMSRIGNRRDEIADLGRDFDHMAEQVQQLVAAQKRLLNDVSHELRSPLARLQVAIEMGRQQPDKVEELTQRIEKECQRLDELVGELLTLSRLEANAQHSARDYFDISGLLASIVADARFEAESQHKVVLFDKTHEVLLNGNMELLRRALENVIRNGIFYTPENSQLEVALELNDGQVEISVCDSGKGVAEEKLARLFDPFVRISDTEQNVKIPGYGLGLAIARRAVEIHRGRIRAFNRQQGGLCIEIRLPVRAVLTEEWVRK
jgi:two-component system OmpR family sensor kinase